jgi:hypothetical protein
MDIMVYCLCTRGNRSRSIGAFAGYRYVCRQQKEENGAGGSQPELSTKRAPTRLDSKKKPRIKRAKPNSVLRKNLEGEVRKQKDQARQTRAKIEERGQRA